MGENYVRLEGEVRRVGVRRGFEGELTSIFLRAENSRGHVHVPVIAKLPGEARERLQEGSTIAVEGELDYEKKRNGGFEVFIFAKKLRLVGEAKERKREEYAAFDF